MNGKVNADALVIKMVDGVVNDGWSIKRVLNKLRAKAKENTDFNPLEVFNSVVDALERLSIDVKVEVSESNILGTELTLYTLIRAIMRGSNIIRELKRLTRNLENEEEQSTFIFAAIAESNIDALKYLIENRKRWNLNTPLSYKGETPINFALSRRNVEAAKLLIENGVKLNIPNKHGGYPIHFATSVEDTSVAALILEKGADIDILDHIGNNALSFAIMNNNKKVAEFLLDKNIKLLPALKTKNERYDGIQVIGENLACAANKEDRDFWINLMDKLREVEKELNKIPL